MSLKFDHDRGSESPMPYETNLFQIIKSCFAFLFPYSINQNVTQWNMLHSSVDQDLLSTSFWYLDKQIMCLVVPMNLQAGKFSQWREKILFFNLRSCSFSESTTNEIHLIDKDITIFFFCKRSWGKERGKLSHHPWLCCLKCSRKTRYTVLLFSASRFVTLN